MANVLSRAAPSVAPAHAGAAEARTHNAAEPEAAAATLPREPSEYDSHGGQDYYEEEEDEEEELDDEEDNWDMDMVDLDDCQSASG